MRKRCTYCSATEMFLHGDLDHCAVCMTVHCEDLSCRLELDHMYRSFYSHLRKHA